MKCDLYKKILYKNLIMAGIPTLISAIGVAISLFEIKSLSYKRLILLIDILFSIVVILYIYYTSKKDYQQIYHDYEKGLIASQSIIKTFISIFEYCVKQIYDTSVLIREGKAISENAFDKSLYYNILCQRCCETINDYCKNNNKTIYVNFIEYSESEKGEKFIEMVADSFPTTPKHKAYEKREKLSDSRYHYAKLIKANQRDIIIAKNNKEIKEKFETFDENSDLSKYKQYIAIPIFCQNDKLLGIFQVVAEYNYIIKNEAKMKNFVNDIIVPCTSLVLLIDKIYKGLYSKPLISNGDDSHANV